SRSTARSCRRGRRVIESCKTAARSGAKSPAQAESLPHTNRTLSGQRVSDPVGLRKNGDSQPISGTCSKQLRRWFFEIGRQSPFFGNFFHPAGVRSSAA